MTHAALLLWPWLAHAEPVDRPLLVVLPPAVESRAKGNDGGLLANMLQNELSSAARGAVVALAEDVILREAVSDPEVTSCVEPACAPKVGKVLKARFVVTSQLAAVGNQRVVTVRLFDSEARRMVAMLTERIGFEDEALPPVTARAALRLSAAAKIQSVPEPKKPAPEPAPEPTPEPVPPPKPSPRPVPTITVPITPPLPQDERPTPPMRPRQQVLLADPNVPDPQALPPTMEETSGRMVGWRPRVGIGVAGVLLGAWAPLLMPPAVVAGLAFVFQAVEIQQRLHERPHDRAEIAAQKTLGWQYTAAAYGLFTFGALVVVYGIGMVVGSLVTAVALP